MILSNMILGSETSSSDTKIKDDNHKIKNSKVKILYFGMICFAINCLSSITLEADLRNSFRSISPRPAVFNNLFRRNYNLRIKIMIGDVLAALVSTTMLTMGDVYGTPYLYLPWLVNTIKGIVFQEGLALFELAHTVLPNANLPAGLFMFITMLLYMVELWIWKDVFMNFERCWTKYNNKLKQDTKSTRMANKKLYNKVKESFDENIVSRKSTQESTAHVNESNHHNIVEPIEKNKSIENNVSIKNRHSKSSIMEVTG